MTTMDPAYLATYIGEDRHHGWVRGRLAVRHFDPLAKIASRLPMRADLGRIRVTRESIVISADAP